MHFYIGQYIKNPLIHKENNTNKVLPIVIVTEVIIRVPKQVRLEDRVRYIVTIWTRIFFQSRVAEKYEVVLAAGQY